ncbi:MAG: DUF6134 family protein [Stellaceae bacterium]
MSRPITFLAACLLAAVLAGSASASPQSYEYRVLHPTYGDIGTYTNLVERVGDATEVTSELRIAVRLLGIVIYRQEARRSEHWQGQQLVAFDSVTVTNSDRIQVHGEARDGGFAVTTPAGTVLAPASVHPSNPWSAMVLNTNVMMSTRTGQILPVRVSGGETEPVALAGSTLRLHQYEIVSDKRQFVWLDDNGTPVAFRTAENGTPIDFVLRRQREVSAADRG